LPLRYPRLVLLLAALTVMAPSLIVGTLVTHSSNYNLMWAGQFAEQVRAGVLYPRWLPQSFAGLGSPTFYFYPPLAFWIDAVVGLVTFDALDVSHRLSVTAALLLWASGLAMHAWLRHVTRSDWAALLGALAYMLAPYHLVDHYLRGAFAEFAAFPFVPLVALGVLLVSEKHRAGVGVLAVAYAALLMAHLPTGLLVSVTLLPLYVLFRASTLGDRQAAIGFMVRAGLAGVLGIGLAASYLVPALLLQEWISAGLLWIEYYQVSPWFLLHPERWPYPNFMRVIAVLALACAFATLALGFTMRGLAPGARRRELGVWLIVSLVCLVLMSGAIPWFWDLPLVAKVQFPWRLMVIVEFALITAFCLAPLGQLRRPAVYAAMAAVAALVPGVIWFANEAAYRIEVTLDAGSLPATDSPEYQPAGYPHPFVRGGYVDPGLEMLAKVPLIDCVPAVRVCAAENLPLGNMRLQIDGDWPTTVTLRRFFFPAWSIEPPRPVAPADPLKLVSFVAPAGRHTFELTRKPLPIEQWGWAISGASLALLLAWLLNERRTR
jgi:uncharacterized membrane protein